MTNHRSGLAYGAIVIFFIAFIARFALFAGILLNNPSYFLTDTDGYLHISNNLLKNHHYSSDGITPQHDRTPVYPFFFFLFKYFGFSNSGVVFVQVILSAITASLTFILAHQLSQDYKIGLISGSLVAIDVPSIVYASCLMTEAVFTLILVISAVYFIRFLVQQKLSLLAISAITMALTILCRPITTYLPFVMAFILALFTKCAPKKRLLQAILYLLVCYLCVMPWVMRNKIVFDHYFISTKKWFNILTDRAVGVYAKVEKMPAYQAEQILVEKAGSMVKEEDKADVIEAQKAMGRLGTSIIMAHPFIYMRNSVFCIFNMLFRPIRSIIDIQLGLAQKGTMLTFWDDWGDKEDQPVWKRFIALTSLPTIIITVFQVLMISILYFAFIWGVVNLILNKDYLTLCFIVLIVGYFAVVSAGPVAYARHRVPMIPFLAIPAGIGISEICKIMKKRALK
ncbi:MAG: glycosyltransferase family 39 protein [Candidatus Omnitrophica bacterium]|nr:glycosyltransferase family 39 protein [Candidatus Omnitrophota bacterium]